MYNDLESAGHHLGVALAKYRGTNSVVLAIANGGVPVAIPVAGSLEAPLELLIIRRLFIQEGRPFPVCAVSVGADILVDSESRELSAIEKQFKQEALEHLSARARYLRGNLAVQNLTGLNVILVDNGIHTGSTVQTAITALRKLQPQSVTVAVPVADASVRGSIESEADEVVCLEWCENFGHAALWYKKFNRPNDEQVRTMIPNRAQRYQLTIE
jgi:putative phosphoribosyl transferase